MKAAKTQKTEIGRCQDPCSNGLFAVILREITGEREEKEALARLRSLLENESLLSWACTCHRRVIHRTIECHSWDLEAVARLANALDPEAPGRHQMAEWLEEIRDQLRAASRAATALDRLLARDVSPPSVPFCHPKLANHLLQVWLSLEIQLRPDERGFLAGLRDQLVHEADRREIDLRDLGI